MKKMKSRIIYLGLLLFAFSMHLEVNACSAFTMKSQSGVYMCKSYDWDFGEGILLFNPRDIQRNSMPVIGNFKGLQWKSKYASLSFNQYGQLLPNGGFNEKGLGVEILWLKSTDFGEVTDEACLNELQWIQYALDNFSSVDELIKLTVNIRVQALYAKVHYYISDASGKAAVIEYINGKRVISTGKNMPCKAITNSTYRNSLLGLRDTAKACSRFCTLNDRLATSTIDAGEMVDRGFDILEAVKSEDRTQWQIVYDLKNQVINFKTRDNSTIRTVALNDFDLKGKKSLYVDLNAPLNQVKSDFKEINLEVNNRLLTNAFEKLELPVPEIAKDMLVNYISTGIVHPQLQQVINMFDQK